MTVAELRQILSLLEQAKRIIEGSIAQKPTLQDHDLLQATLRLQKKTYVRLSKLQPTNQP